MKRWLVRWGLDRRYLEVIAFPRWKPAAFVTIDDRAICFTGQFPDAAAVLQFTPWWYKTHD